MKIAKDHCCQCLRVLSPAFLFHFHFILLFSPRSWAAIQHQFIYAHITLALASIAFCRPSPHRHGPGSCIYRVRAATWHFVYQCLTIQLISFQTMFRNLYGLILWMVANVRPTRRKEIRRRSNNKFIIRSYLVAYFYRCA